jgi:peptidoglycan hydrolase-like protein with peptidoglycan-binding domain
VAKFIIGAIVLFVIYKLWQNANPKFAGLVATGWGGGNLYGNMPGLLDPRAIVGQATGAAIYQGNNNAQPFAPGNTTNNGSAGG